MGKNGDGEPKFLSSRVIIEGKKGELQTVQAENKGPPKIYLQYVQDEV